MTNSSETILHKTDNLFWSRSNELIEPYGFIYITTNLINGKRYIGQKKFDDWGQWKYYLGSGTYLQKAIDKYGSENFSRGVVDIAFSKEDLDKKEYDWIEYYKAVTDENYYNLIEGGGMPPNPFRLIKSSFHSQRVLFVHSVDWQDWELMKMSDPNLSEQ